MHHITTLMEQEQYFTHTLPNGLRIIHKLTHSPVTYCGFAVNAGTRDEDQKHPGMAHFIEHMLFKGTAKRRAWHILNRMENVGGDLNAFTNKEETVLYCAFMNEHLGRAVELLSDLVFNSVFPERELARETEVIVDEIESYEDSPAELIYDDFEDLIFSGHPLGRNILGNANDIRTYTSADAMAFYKTYYCPDNMVFFVAGNHSFQQVCRLVARCVADRPCGGMLPVRREPLPYATRFEHRERQTHQSHIMIGNRAFNGYSNRRTALNLLCNILGGPGMNSWLNVSLREHRGLVYDIETSYTAYTDTGTCCIYFGCSHEDSDRCRSLTMKEIARLRDNRLSEARLHAAKKQMIGQLGVGQENHENNVMGMARTFLHYDRYVTLQQACQSIEALTADTLQDVAQEVFAANSLSVLHYS